MSLFLFVFSLMRFYIGLKILQRDLMNQAVAAESFCQKIKADVLRWRPRFTIASFVRLLLLQPGFQLAFSIRLQEQLGRVPYLGKRLRRILWYITTICIGSDIDPQIHICVREAGRIRAAAAILELQDHTAIADKGEAVGGGQLGN